jgi:hypothetical protein
MKPTTPEVTGSSRRECDEVIGLNARISAEIRIRVIAIRSHRGSERELHVKRCACLLAAVAVVLVSACTHLFAREPYDRAIEEAMLADTSGALSVFSQRPWQQRARREEIRAICSLIATMRSRGLVFRPAPARCQI